MLIRWRNHLLLILAFIVTVLPEMSAANIESGVSRALARQRNATVSDVVYNLSLNLDTLMNLNPTGTVGILFEYQNDNNPLQIDFTGEAIKRVIVNGHEIIEPVWLNEHIIIGNENLVAGKNTVEIEFTSAGRALNRNPGYMYTLFVPNRAHSVFPCFDQPDMKACYNLTLTVPKEWKAVSNSPVVSSFANPVLDSRTIKFGSTEPLSTYLFAFAAGEFDYRQHTDGARTIGAYYRETEPDRLAQLDEIFSQVESSLRQLEDYTGIDYPFAKYDLVILPGFQFGGMEHTGATFYNDNTIFLGKNATGADLLKRAKLIAHETSHMWFGDYVTMEWFDDVWTKEVFANYFAAMLTRKLLPEFDHEMEWLRVYMTPALDQDRSAGSTPIRQELDNLKDAGLIYNNIIYNKSPLMMAKLAEITGEENFKKGIRKYLNDNAFGNATWDDLIYALSAYSDGDIEGFSRVWVYEPGMPEINFKIDKNKLTATQKDSRGRGIVWPQTFNVVVGEGNNIETVVVSFDGTTDTVIVKTSVNSDSPLIFPSADGRAYGLLTTDAENLARIMEDMSAQDGITKTLSPVGRLATLMMLNENYLVGNITSSDWLKFLIKSIERTSDSQMLSVLTGYVGAALTDLTADEAAPFEEHLFDIVDMHPVDQGKTLILRKLIASARAPQSVTRLYELWKRGQSALISKDDFSNLALQLAIVMPESGDSIISTQRERIGEGDRLREFDFISQAAVSDTVALDSLFESLREPQNRLVEPWTLSLLSLLNHPSRHDRSVHYIVPALEMLPDLQKTGDIFFPANWSASLLGSYRSKEAADYVESFLNDNKEMSKHS